MRALRAAAPGLNYRSCTLGAMRADCSLFRVLGVGVNGLGVIKFATRASKVLNIAALVFLATGYHADGSSPAYAGHGADRYHPGAREARIYFVAEDGNDANPGTRQRPWATLSHAVEKAVAGDTVLVRGGRYLLFRQVRPTNSGRRGEWITISGYPGEIPILNAERIARSSLAKDGLDNGVFQIEDRSYIRVTNLMIVNSHDAGFTIRDSRHIDLINNSTQGTFSSGIAVWATKQDGATAHIRILGNTITKATTWDLAPDDLPRQGEPPHEALSVGGAVDFEVAYNRIAESEKEGIDVKETSKHGSVHHNVIDHAARQGVYVDAWFGRVSDIAIYSNVIRRCHGAGIALSVENGEAVQNLIIRNNLVFDNDGSGLFFSRWGVDNLRRRIRISCNVFYHNGYGRPTEGQEYYWLTGGIYLYSTNVKDITVVGNIFSANRGFQIGYSELYFDEVRLWRTVAHKKNIQIIDNLIEGPNDPNKAIEGGGNPIDQVKIYAVNGKAPILGDPLFQDLDAEDFALQRDSPLSTVRRTRGCFAFWHALKPWWKSDFPPKLVGGSSGK
jgi:hypothetical protein